MRAQELELELSQLRQAHEAAKADLWATAGERSRLREALEGLVALFKEWRDYSEAETMRKRVTRSYVHGRQCEVGTLSAVISELEALLPTPGAPEASETPRT